MKNPGILLLAVAGLSLFVTMQLTADSKLEQATFAGGCFWCVEAGFEKVNGVKEATSGYTGGDEKNPTYKDVSSGKTNHLEAVLVSYDPAVVSYSELLDAFWRQFDPTDAGGSFVDRGHQYTSAIFYHNAGQEQLARSSKAALEASGRFDKPIVTPILQAGAFYAAEEYHQDFYKKSADHYNRYRSGSGRDQFIKRVWGEEKKSTSMYQIPSKSELKKKLTAVQYNVTQEEGTERPFRNEYWDNKKAGIYVDIVSGEPLFSSTDKYDSGTGWPSFSRPLVEDNIVDKTDYKLLMKRVEVRSKHADSHLGHVFDDGPRPTGLRYCINSAALRFVPKEELAAQGYADFVNLFDSEDGHVNR